MTVKKTTHFCTQAETIQRLSYFLVGNGKPQDGILFKFQQFMGEHNTLLEDIKEIKDGVVALHEKSDENKKAAETAMRAIEKYKLEESVFKAGKDDIIKANKLKRNLFISRLAAAITISISLFMAYLGYQSLMTQSKKVEIESKVTNELLAPDSTQETVTIRGSVYIPILKTDSANVIRKKEMVDAYDKFMEKQND